MPKEQYGKDYPTSAAGPIPRMSRVERQKLQQQVSDDEQKRIDALNRRVARGQMPPNKSLARSRVVRKGMRIEPGSDEYYRKLDEDNQNKIDKYYKKRTMRKMKGQGSGSMGKSGKRTSRMKKD